MIRQRKGTNKDEIRKLNNREGQRKQHLNLKERDAQNFKLRKKRKEKIKIYNENPVPEHYKNIILSKIKL